MIVTGDTGQNPGICNIRTFVNINTTDLTVLAWTCARGLRKDYGDSSLTIAKRSSGSLTVNIFEQHYFSLEQSGDEMLLNSFRNL